MPQKETLDIAAYTCLLVFYRRLSPLFQFSLSAVTLVYLSQWGGGEGVKFVSTVEVTVNRTTLKTFGLLSLLRPRIRPPDTNPII